jgi:DNA-binding NarL/FixJ family response regulator
VLLESDLENEHDFVSAALRSGYRGKFLVMSSSAEPKDSAHALKRGVSGVFLKTESVARLLQAVRAVAQGEIWIDPKVIQGLVERFPEDGSRGEHDFPPLSEREHRVLGGIIDGLSNKKIGDALTISEGSVKAVVQQLFEKAGVRTRSQLVRIAMERSLNAVGRQISGG